MFITSVEYLIAQGLFLIVQNVMRTQSIHSQLNSCHIFLEYISGGNILVKFQWVFLPFHNKNSSQSQSEAFYDSTHFCHFWETVACYKGARHSKTKCTDDKECLTYQIWNDKYISFMIPFTQKIPLLQNIANPMNHQKLLHMFMYVQQFNYRLCYNLISFVQPRRNFTGFINDTWMEIQRYEIEENSIVMSKVCKVSSMV